METSPPDIEQISLSLSVERNMVTPAHEASKERQRRDLDTFRSHCLCNFGDPPRFKLHERLAPFHICVSKTFAAHVREVHTLLDRALVNIIERWFSDTKANFPGRMPLEKHEEDLLRWIDGPGREVVQPFRERYGMWRTDYLVEDDAQAKYQIKICEINARIPFNGIWLIGLHGEAYRNQISQSNLRGLDIPDDFGKTKEVILENFDTSKPLYHVHDKWPGVDSIGFLHAYSRFSGQPIQHVKPSQLRLPRDKDPASGYRLLYQPEDHDQPLEIQQCTLELFQEELEDIDPALLRKLATCCTNDFRNILLIHDKRILSIVLDELDDLVARRVMTKDEAVKLRDCVADTLLPGSHALRDLLDKSRTNDSERNSWIVKPVRDAACNGIKLGADMAQDQWLATLEEQSSHALRPKEGAVVVQRLAKHVWFDITRHDDAIPSGKSNGTSEGTSDTKSKRLFHLIGSLHLVNSRYNMFGPWRLGRKIHVGLAGQDAEGIVMSTVLRPDGMTSGTEKE